LNYEALHPPLNPQNTQKYTFLRGFEPDRGGFHPKRTRILHGNCTPIARLGTTSFSVVIRLLLGEMGEGSVGGELGQLGFFQYRNQWKYFPR